jgi:hypothetical protein
MDAFTKQHGRKSYLEETSKCHIFHTGARADKYGRRYEPPTNDKLRLEYQIFFAKKELDAAATAFTNIKKLVLDGRSPLAGWDVFEFGQPPEDHGDNYTPPGKVTLERLTEIHASRAAWLEALQEEYNALPEVAAVRRRQEIARIADQQRSRHLGQLHDSLRAVTL